MTQIAPVKQVRDTLLLSHANPEDNEFTLWLALQLANEGYRVWCDLTKLLGGEVFWDDIEEVIKTRAVKVLYVLSRTSNAKDGPLKELHFAQGVAKREKLKDFVIPLHIDDLPHGEITIEITRVNTVPFAQSWGAGLAKLLEKLEKDKVPKNPKFNRTAVNDWWRTQFSSEQGMRKEPEDYLSNWFPITLPTHIYFHSLSRKSIGVLEVAPTLPYPAVQDGMFLITFAEAADFEGKLGPEMYIAKAGEPVEVAALLAEPKSTFGKHLFQLLRVAWEEMLAERRLPVYELANKAKCFYFPKERVPNDKVFFTGVDGERTYRAMVGYATRTNPTTGVSVKRFWHYAVQARPLVHPTLAYIFKSHVLFTNDGTTIWESKKRLASARRSQCKSWWNDEWRDRTLAAATYLCDGADHITVKLGSTASLNIPPTPLPFCSPVSYTDPQLLRFSEDDETADDYGRDSRDDAFEDDATEGDGAMNDLIHIPEPRLLFRHDQAMEDPRDGLTLFGPLDESKPYGIKAGVIGTETGIKCFDRWVEWVQRPVFNTTPLIGRPPFPGFETVFRSRWNTKPLLTLTVTDAEIDEYLYLDEPHQRVYGTVGVFSKRILGAIREETEKPELWFVVVPDKVWKYCRPKSIVEPEVRQQALRAFKQAKQAKAFYETRALFTEMEKEAEPYVYEEEFHNQLKARLLDDMVLTQIVRESTLSNILKPTDSDFDARAAARQSEIAWNLCTAIFYKVGGRPWKVAEIRDGVCYVGLVFKKDETTGTSKNACCAAQMFLDSGDGVVFKGALGPWYNEDTGDFHLKYEAAKALGELAIKTYTKKAGRPPKEMFVHGKVRFEAEEWAGFADAAGTDTNMVGVRIREEKNLKLYRKGQNPVLRGLANIRGARGAHLWTRGWTPRIQTYPGREVPNPLVIDISEGEADINVVLKDILALTKLNYNTCIFGDGMPITLKFADAVGEILTAGPIKDVPPLPFGHYI